MLIIFNERKKFISFKINEKTILLNVFKCKLNINKMFYKCFESLTENASKRNLFRFLLKNNWFKSIRQKRRLRQMRQWMETKQYSALI